MTGRASTHAPTRQGGVLRRILSRLRFGALDRAGETGARQRTLENSDAVAAARFGDTVDPNRDAGGMPPPGYVKSYDEGRPRT